MDSLSTASSLIGTGITVLGAWWFMREMQQQVRVLRVPSRWRQGEGEARARRNWSVPRPTDRSLLRDADAMRARAATTRVAPARCAHVRPFRRKRSISPRPQNTNTHAQNQTKTQEERLARESPERRPCATCGGRGVEACACTRWSDGDAGCSTCAHTGWAPCRHCRGGGNAVPIRVTLPVRERE